MKEAEGLLSETHKKEDFENRDVLLKELQQAAIDIGTEIEKSEGEGIKAVSDLEDYCELLWQCSQASSDAELLELLRKLSELRAGVKDIVCQTFKETMEVVFLPYKASMWDSMESIWLAAKEDKLCETYVIPIPYVDKNPDRTVKALHLEKEEFPGYVPITNYQEYNLQKRHPDIIYFHNPYDQYNRITSVFPEYYSSELKKCTDMLVYIPYFVCVDDVPKHLCLTPGVVNADRVIVQSEKIRQTYINVFLELMEGSEEEEGFKTKNEQYWIKVQKAAEAKFLALGSPKFDKVLNSKAEDFEIPKEWKTKIYKIDGSKRKVILYNTSIQNLLDNKEEYLKKIRFVMDTFKGRDDIVIWWRPHPLLLSAAESMIRALADELKIIIEQFNENNIGIFDDTADVNRAICLSDAYYGDGGSVLALYKITGKPIMLQNVEVLE